MEGVDTVNAATGVRLNPGTSESGNAETRECKIVERCVYTTPFGWPVVPLV